MIIDVMPGLTRLFLGHLPTRSALASALLVAGACIAAGTSAAWAMRAGAARRRLARRGRRPR
jgi:hypothetical protein